jgi:hypothetical protein
MSVLSKVAVAAFFMLFIGITPLTVQAEVDWEISGAIQMNDTPLDVARSQGDNLTFILTDKSKVLIYETAGELAGTIPVDPSVTGIAISAKGDQLFLINSQRKTLKTVSVDFIVEFNNAGSPFLGPANAPIVVAVFSDFQ